ncbi:MotA/TolQ/ExbB proton channel family protein [Puniceicoccus vermicola]|uniref:MotA/TolQ/ExbB proton channel family protein n=1 Tax=Puniceicoccus vermicola TaxID=388746 RepID=A0A7X1B229_9BACT|nr:MotA/TolQ/ExbB proton channel family protein [Puniceicoccus vermicola]MBC2604193.1 MotA/TolQ/ExbB proton channel family protein [Puniceicoccus vermicola]
MIATEFLAAADPSVFTYFFLSNLAGQGIIILLAIGSVVAWTVMIAKGFELNRIRSGNLRFEQSLNRGQPLIDLDLTTLQTRKNPYATLVVAAIQAFYRWDGATESEHPKRMNQVENALQRVIARETVNYEGKMVMLATIVTGAPFLGLLGTVWGVMDSFGGVALAGSATLKSLAPGVSGALLTTVAGLGVAIPSVFGYNYLLARVRRMTMELENFASSVADRLELESR